MTYNEHESQESLNSNGHGKAVFAGVLLGGLTGALTALLFAPQSGKQTRILIKNKATEVRDLAGEKVEGAVGQIRTKADQVKVGVSSKARVLKEQGRDVLVEQLDRVSAAAESGKKNLQGRRG